MPFGFIVVDPWLPPQGLAALALLVLLFGRRRFWWVAALLIAALLALSTPLVGAALLASLDPAPAAGQDAGPPPGAIVILSGDVERAAPPAAADVGPLTLERERAGAALARRTGLPVLVTGGLVIAPPPVGAMMAASLPADFGVPVRWAETRSATTWENAQFSVPMLKADGITRIYLVTHAWHMRRSLLAFARAGMDAVPVPVRQDPGPDWTLASLMPRATGWERSFYAIHEWIGLLAYGLRH